MRTRRIVLLALVLGATLLSPVAPPVEASTAPTGWWTSEDEVFVAKSDERGYHLYRGKEAERWLLRRVTTVLPDIGDAGEWTGYHCITGDGRWAVIVVAPRMVANRPTGRDRGALAYVTTTAPRSTARPLASGVALKYYNPGCGAGSTVALTSHEAPDQAVTRVRVFDAATGAEKLRAFYNGQLTSAVPYGDAVVAAADKGLVELSAGAAWRVIGTTPGLPYQLRASERSVDFLVTDGSDRVGIWRLADGRVGKVGDGTLGETRLFAGRAGRNVVVNPGSLAPTAGLVAAHTDVTPARGTSLLGGAVVTNPTGKADSDDVLPVLRDGETSEALTAVWQGRSSVTDAAPVPLPGDVTGGSAGGGGGAGDHVHPSVLANHSPGGPGCAISRNHVRRQVPQPNAAQVNWAIQQATRNLLKGTVSTRPTDYLNTGVPSYQPSNDFARHPLTGAASTVPVPPSVIQGVYAQESAWKQASFRAVAGVAGNPLVGDYYGAGGTLDTINYAEADCGYGISQVTEPMEANSHTYSMNGKIKVAVDYAENVAAGIQFLVDKWNQLQSENVLLNNNDPSLLENWYFAIWAYNTGYNPPDANSREGLGWTNNPMNADYPPDRDPFLRMTYADAEHPADWPYQERVFGWMETPMLDYKGNPSYAEPNYLGTNHVAFDIPARTTFCTAANWCDTNHLDGPPNQWGIGDLSYCTLADRHCWWNTSVTYTTCPTICTQSTFTVSTTATEPAGDNNYPPNCSALPPQSSTSTRPQVIVDEQPSNINVEGCNATWTSQGTFEVVYGDADGQPVGQIDWHQLGTGFGGHTWFTKNRRDISHTNTGTWTPPTLTGTYRIHAHIPPSGASTPTAQYTIHTGLGTTFNVTINQHLHENRWVSLGDFALTAGAKVVLTNVTSETVPGTTNVAFDAMAFTPLDDGTTGTPIETTYDLLSIFDEEQDVDTARPSIVSNDNPMRTEEALEEWAKSRIDAVVANAPCLPGVEHDLCIKPATLSAFGFWGFQVDTQRAAQWLRYSNIDPPAVMTAEYAANPQLHKLHNRVRVRYEINPSTGAIDPSSVDVDFTAVAGYAKMPTFIIRMIDAMLYDYGIQPPDLSYEAENLGTYNHQYSDGNPLATDGDVPGREFRPHHTWSMSGGCIQVNAVGGGTNGWKPMLNEGGVAGPMEAWTKRVEDAANAGRMPYDVAQAALDTFVYFFSNEYNWFELAYKGAPARWAPPIWLQQKFQICPGTSTPIVVANNVDPIAWASYMPDVYAYVNGQSVDLDAQPQGSAVPVYRGDFLTFSNDPNGITEPPSGFGTCDVYDGSEFRSGNPWNMGILDKETRGNEVGFCDDHSTQVSSHP